MAAATATAVGTTSRRALDLGRFGVSEIAFPPGRRLPWHAHPRACIAVVLAGAVRKRFAASEGVAADGTVVTMPAEEPHEDEFGRDGARIVVVETDDEVGAVKAFRDWTATHLALRIAGELADPDPLTPLAVEGLALELAVVSQRGPVPVPAARWLESVRELLDERFREPPSATEIATEVGVHPSHLARAFRAHYGDSLGVSRGPTSRSHRSRSKGGSSTRATSRARSSAGSASPRRGTGARTADPKARAARTRRALGPAVASGPSHDKETA